MNAEKDRIKKEAIEVLKTIFDPEIPVNLYDLGLIYELKVSDDNVIHVKMTLTAPGCPVAHIIVAQVEEFLREIPGVKDVKVDLVWDPPWSPRMITPEGRETLKAMFGYDIVEKWIQQYDAMQKQAEETS